MTNNFKYKLSFIGSAGIPNLYGGFESFLENCAPEISKNVDKVYVTCDSSLYTEKNKFYNGVERIFIPIKANGASSILHDAVAFLSIFKKSSHIIVLGVSGGIWFPFFRILCDIFRKKLIVNIDGIEWRRSKFNIYKRFLLKIFDSLAQIFSHKIVYDNKGLLEFIIKTCLQKSHEIAYSGDHILKFNHIKKINGTALTICRIEPENNIHILIEGFLKSNFLHYTIVGNWKNSEYGTSLLKKYKNNPRLNLLDPIYDPLELARLRQSCDVYLHGHSVGGTNPSLVEIIYYDCRIICYDVIFNRITTKNTCQYFSNEESLAFEINNTNHLIYNREILRCEYSAKIISKKYLEIL